MKLLKKLFGWFFIIRNISIKVKIILLVFFPALGIISFFSFTFYDTYNYMHANTELTGMIQISVEVSKVSHQLQIERGLTAGYMTDKSPTSKEAIDAQRINSDEAINNFFSFINATNIKKYDPAYVAQINSAEELLKGLVAFRQKADNFQVTNKEVIAYYTKTISTLIDSVLIASNVSPDNNITKILGGYTNFMYAKENTGLERANGNVLLRSKTFNEETYRSFLSVIAKQEVYLSSFFGQLPKDNQKAKDILENYNLTMEETVPIIDGYRQDIIHNAIDCNFTTTGDQWFEDITYHIDNLQIIEEIIAELVNDILVANIHAAKIKLIYITAFFAFGMIFNIILAVVIASDLMKFKEFYAIYADIIENIDFNMGCGTYKINDKLALIIRDKERLLDIRINSRRKKSYILSRTRTLF